MARLDQFLIAPMTEGQQTDVAPWLIPDQAFSQLKNAYVWRGRVRKRFGSKFITPSVAPTAGFEQLTSRLRINLGNTDGSGDLAGTVPGAIFKVGQMFSIGTDLFTVVALGAPGTMITNGAATTLTYDTTNGAYDIQGSDATTAVFFYPSEPVMGLVNYEVAAINDEPTFGFDTQFAYRYLSTGWARLGTALWTGTDSQFFWPANYRGANSFNTILFVTNNSSTDGVRYWDGSTWVAFQPLWKVGAGNIIKGCRLIISFKNRLLFLNTFERDNGTGVTSNHPNRCRYSQNGDPTVSATSWLEGPETPGKGGFVDAPTQEFIISARILRDRLVVFFERSTWELVFTGNNILPFRFQRINSELGAESTFSTVLFDKVLLGVGNVGIHACNGANVERIDNKIPQEVFDFHNGNDGVERVYGIRDYTAELVYWALPASLGDPTFPTRVLVYNYRNKTWSLNDDSITCFGYLQNLNDETWEVATQQWQERTDTWQGAVNQSEHRNVIAGNQQGYTFLIDQDLTRNAGVLQITQLVNVAGEVSIGVEDHNLQKGDFILIENVLGATGLEGIYQILGSSLTVLVVGEPTFAGTYTGGGTIARVSKIDIRTKEYNFYQKEGADLYVPRVSFYVDRTENGEISVDFSPSSSSRSLVEDGVNSGSILGNSILETTPYPDETIEASQKRFWHVIYMQAQGETVQIRLYLSDAQMLDEDIALSDFQLNAMSIYSKRVPRY